MSKRNGSNGATATLDPPAPAKEPAPEANGAHTNDGVFRMVPIGQITPSKTNPRKAFDQAGLVELAASIQVKGVLEPLLVRPYGGLVGPDTRIYNLAIGDGNADAIEAAKKLEQHGIDTLAELGAKADLMGGHTRNNAIYGAIRAFPGILAAEARALLLVLTGPEDGKTGEGYELVAGERRFRAAELAGAAVVPVIVRQLSDLEALEIQIIENEQREDLGPLEKANGYAVLIEKHKQTVDQVAAKVGKSTSTIRGLLRLRQLPEIVRPAVGCGHLPASTAQLIARVPGAEDRQTLALQVLAGEKHYRGDSTTRLRHAAIAAEKEGRAPLSYRDVKELVERQFMVELKTAPFSRKALDLVPTAGSCDACPKRAGNAPEEYPGVRADVCTDPACYRQKCIAHGLQLAGGQGELIQGKKAEQLFRYGSIPHGSPYVDLAERCWEDAKSRSYKTLVGAELQAQTKVALNPSNGQVHLLVPKEAAAKILKEKGIGRTSTSSSGANDSWRREQKAREQKAKINKQAARHANGLASDLVEQIASGTTRWPEDAQPALRALARFAWDRANHESQQQLIRRRQVAAEDLEKRIGGMSIPEALGLVAELVAADKSDAWGFSYSSGTQSKEDAALWKALGVDRAKLFKQFTAAAAAKAKPKKKARAAK